MKIYLAGPDVFRPDVKEWAAGARSLCLRYGFEPLLPVDHPETSPELIFAANIDLIRKAQIVAANLDPFRGPEPDSGTAFEVGYALALRKKVVGYVTNLTNTAERVRIAEGCDALERDSNGRPVDRNGWTVEHFGLTCNLMLAIPAPIVDGGLEACLQSLRSR